MGAIEALKALERGNFGAIQAEQKQVFLTMIRSHQTTLQIIETLLLIYRNDSEGLELSCHPVDLAALAEEATKPLLALAANRRIHISFNYGDSDFRKFLWVNGDSLQLMRVLANLLINAINHSPRGGKIEVVLEAGSSVQTVKLFRLGLRVRLQMESGLEIVAEAEDGETAVEILRHQSVDVVLLDIGLPGIGAVEACRQIKQLYPHLPILVLTSHTQEFLINRMINSGVQGYCLKGIASETLLLAIRSLAAGASWWDKNATPKIQAAFAEHPPIVPEEVNTEPSPLLTRREQEILALIAQGQSNREIAEKLYITHGTVRVHVHAILHKLKVRDRTQAALLAIQRQLIEQDLIGSLPNS